ncbi:hypothetical protein ACK1X7_37185 [Streptomyces sp. CY1]|uniref:hypothetical protein n=1 Tax=Streptomyces sp. CY1 TaxID=3388313 RepID=UPI0039A0D208
MHRSEFLYPTSGPLPDRPTAGLQRPRPHQYFAGSIRVPYITPWTGENARQPTMTTRLGRVGYGIGYADEYGIADRARGALWVRMPVKPGAGGPLLGRIHALRQRQAMYHMLCQGCGQPTVGGRGDQRHLFLMTSATGQPIAEGEKTVTPPSCADCAVEAALEGPPSRSRYVAVLVEHVLVWGVAGIVYSPDTLVPVPRDSGNEFALVAYDDPRLPWTLACREVVSLHGCTAMDLKDLTVQSAV